MLAGALLLATLVLASFDVAAVISVRQFMLTQADGLLLRTLERARDRLALNPDYVHRHPQPIRQLVDGDYYLELVESGGRVVALVSGTKGGVESAPDPGLRPRLPGDVARLGREGASATVEAAQGSGVLRIRAMAMPGGTLVVATDQAGIDQTVDRLELVLGVGSVAALVVLGVGVLIIVVHGLRPLETMAEEADRIGARDLAYRVTAPGRATEVGRLGAAINRMLARIEESVRERDDSQLQLQRFLADASHELRTPLASLRANAELYGQGALRGRAQLDEVMRRIGIEAERMGALVDDMLRLARLDHLPEQRRDPLDLSALLEVRVEAAMAADRERSWEHRIEPGLSVLGDEELLRRAIDNLLANVRTHTPPGTAATLTARRAGGRVLITVSDHGPGVPASELGRIFGRFHRAGGGPRSQGSGLGLAIVAGVAAAHGGDAIAEVNPPHGLRVTFSLPTS